MASLPRFNPGDSVHKALNHGFLNELVTRLNRPTGSRTSRETVDSNSTIEVLAINNTSGPFDEFNIVTPIGLGLNLNDESDRFEMQRRPFISIDEPILATDFPCVTLEPIPANGGIGKVAVGGVALCKVNFGASSDLYANPTPSVSTHMTSSATQGYARVLWKESGTGVLWALIAWEQPGSSGFNKTYIATFLSQGLDQGHTLNSFYRGSGSGCVSFINGSQPAAFKFSTRMVTVTNGTAVPGFYDNIGVYNRYVFMAPNTSHHEYYDLSIEFQATISSSNNHYSYVEFRCDPLSGGGQPPFNIVGAPTLDRQYPTKNGLEPSFGGFVFNTWYQARDTRWTYFLNS